MIRSRNFSVVSSLFLALAFVAGCSDKPESNKLLWSPSNAPAAILTPEEARNLGSQKIRPILASVKDDPIPEVRALFAQLFQLQKAGKVQIRVALDVPLGVTAETKVDRRGQTGTWQTAIYLSAQEIIRTSDALSPSDFRDHMLIALGHEVLHVLYTPAKPGEKYTQLRFVDGETKAVALTITRLIRPMLKAGRNVGAFEVTLSDAYRVCGDNAASKEWRDWIEKNYCAVAGK